MKGIYNTKNLVLVLLLCFAASAQSQVGIGTVDPKAMLDVNGTATIGDTLTANGKLILNSLGLAPTNTNDVAQLVRKNDTGEVYAVRSSTGNAKPFNYVKYTIKCSSGQPDWIQRFDTKIPVNDYIVFIVGSQFSASNPDIPGMKMTPDYVSPSVNGTFGPENVIAFKEELVDKVLKTYNTWQLRADFAAASPASTTSGAGTWELHCIIINTVLVQQLGNPVVTLTSENGAAPSMPAGL